MRSHRHALVATSMAAVMTVGVAACTGEPSPSAGDAASSQFVGHVHGLGVDPADDTVYVAAHGGVFRLTDGRLELVANRAQDTMGFTVVGPNHFVASGHPAPTDLDRPVHLGLIESTDAAQTWTELSLAGKADFHSIEQGVNALYAYDSRSGSVMVSTDQEQWVPVMKGDVYDLAGHPSHTDSLVAATPTGVVRIESKTQTSLTTPEDLVVLEWPTTDGLVGITAAGTVHRSGDAGQSWEEVGQVPGTVEAFEAATARQWLVATDQGIYTSTDRGGSWTKLL